MKVFLFSLTLFGCDGGEVAGNSVGSYRASVTQFKWCGDYITAQCGFLCVTAL